MTTGCENRQALAGSWKRTIAGRGIDYVSVPGSYRPVGECILNHTFTSPWGDAGGGGRVFLVTEGVMASAEFTLNGTVLGTAGPWATYRFEIPAGLLQKENQITAHIRDLVEPFGTTPGRRYDAGLNRDIYLERRPAAYIASVAFRPVLDADCTTAHCMVSVEIDGATDEQISLVLAERDTGRVVAMQSVPAGQRCTFTVDWPRLWSPEMPNLYTLTVRLSGITVDEVVETVGFRRLEVRAQDFYLNNQRLVLRGICRHEFTSRHGYSPTVEEVRRELAMIKHTGFNYMRLVHSPHSPVVSRIAAELGLLVSEEPGTCWHNLGDPAVAAPALETLRRTVLRDRNVPSVMAFYIYNECDPNITYAKNAAALCRELAPDCLLSFADSSGQDDKVQEMLHEAGLSYYGINMYTIWWNDYVERMKKFTDRPLIFTEWGGCLLQGNQRQLEQTSAAFVKHTQPDAEPRIAGCSFWAWADYEEHSRALPAAIDGWTVEGLLDQQAHPRADLQTLSQMCFAMQHPDPVYLPTVEILARRPERTENWQPLSLATIAGEQAALVGAVEAKTRSRFTYRMPAVGTVLLGGIPFSCREGASIDPLLLGVGRAEIVIPVNRTLTGLAILGHVALVGGYPANDIYSVYHPDQEEVRALGQPASHYRFIFDQGSEDVPLAHGLHMLRSNNICRWWKVTPYAPETTPALQIVLHPSYEILRFDLWEHIFDTPRVLREIRWTLDDTTSIQAMLALSLRIG